MGLVALGDHKAHALGDTVVHPDGLAPRERDSGYKCYLTLLPTSDCNNFCKRFSEAVARTKAGGQRVEVTECVRFPVANVVKAVKKNKRRAIRSSKGGKHSIRSRTWQVLARHADVSDLLRLGCYLNLFQCDCACCRF